MCKCSSGHACDVPIVKINYMAKPVSTWGLHKGKISEGRFTGDHQSLPHPVRLSFIVLIIVCNYILYVYFVSLNRL